MCVDPIPLNPYIWQNLRLANSSRGPDVQTEYQLTPYSSPTLSVLFVASELRLRGEAPVLQPHLKNGNVLCWNGEIFDGMEISVAENDGVKLMDVLSSLENPDSVPELLGHIEGPYAFTFYHNASRKLYFARDPLGRRSLLIHTPTVTQSFFLLASVSAGADQSYALKELSTDHIYCLDLTRFQEQNLDDNNIEIRFKNALKQWPRHTPDVPNQPFAAPRRMNDRLPSLDYLERPLDSIRDFLTESIDGLIDRLDRSVKLQVNNIPAITKLEAQCDSVDGRICGSRTQGRVAVLFSGGIDSAVIAYLAHKHVPMHESIDLLNVAFENPRKMKLLSKATSKTAEVSYLVPDRVTGLQELEELRRICPGRQWNFVEVNVPYPESQAARPLVQSIMYPSRTVMDLSLALALYFASRGIGQVRDTPASEPRPYTSPARVLLNGLGADELLGGYSRHRTSYETGGWRAAIDELQLDLDRIPTRNLGRDDRIISSHGKEARHPFLSLSVVNFLAGLPVEHKMDPRLELGLGDKMLLRLASEKMGLVEASRRKKRAMQFGSYSASMNGIKRGDDTLDD
ncbi:asparagine synthase-domain-containing protein [Amanita rubescens]|nr:asparagine synthase-domain-containing protein [Amanita rubescens]